MAEHPALMSGPMMRAYFAGLKGETRRVMNPQPPTPEQFPGSTFGLDRAVADNVKMYSQNDYDRLPKHPTDWGLLGSVGVARDAGFPMRYRCPFGQVGDSLWFRESFIPYYRGLSEVGIYYPATHDSKVITDEQAGRFKVLANWKNFYSESHEITLREIKRILTVTRKPSIHMPRWASRATPKILSIRAERLQSITRAGAAAEGVCYLAETDWAETHKGIRIVQRHHWPEQNYARLWDSLNGSKPGRSWEASPWVWVIEFEKYGPSPDPERLLHLENGHELEASR